MSPGCVPPAIRTMSLVVLVKARALLQQSVLAVALLVPAVVLLTVVVVLVVLCVL